MAQDGLIDWMLPGARAGRRPPTRSPEGREAQVRSQAAYREKVTDQRPFVGVDGEGAGVDAAGRQCYLLMRAGDAELYTGQPLSTLECLAFLADLPSSIGIGRATAETPIYVGFSFGYDVTMILKDLPRERRKRLFMAKTTGPGRSRTTWFHGFGIEYLPKNYLRVCRLRPKPRRDDKPGRTWGSGPGVVVYETFGFFQMPFLNALVAFEIGSEEQREAIGESKGERGKIPTITAKERAYCQLECTFLAQMMDRFRDVCLAAGLRPRVWSGAGKLAAALHARHKTVTRAFVEANHAAVMPMATNGYYGGRFEISLVGMLPGPVYEYDLRSAYPAAMGKLPCLLHGQWEEASPAWLKRDFAKGGEEPNGEPNGELWIAPLRFRHVQAGRPYFHGLPLRMKDGHLTWPGQGQGVYWSPEVRAARKLGCQVPRFETGWRYVKSCDCKPFAWVEPLYRERLRLGKDLQGYPLKLALNALYGLLCQRVGTPRFANFVWAGLVTAWTRAAILDAVALDPAAIAMIATDGILSIRPLEGLPISDGLGDWEAKQHASIFITQPGLYWGGGSVPTGEKRKFKTRGAAPRFFAKHTETFERTWRDFCAEYRRPLQPGRFRPSLPAVAIPVTVFTGLKLAYARNRDLTAGIWVEHDPAACMIPDKWGRRKPCSGCKQFSFDFTNKRIAGQDGLQFVAPECVQTFAPPGNRTLKSHPHKGDPELLDTLDLARSVYVDEQPDMIDFGPPHKDA